MRTLCTIFATIVNLQNKNDKTDNYNLRDYENILSYE